MSKDPERDEIVNAIIWPIDPLATLDDDEISAPLTDEELAEFDNLPPIDFTPDPEWEAGMRRMVESARQWWVYRLAMMERGLPYYDFAEWENLTVKPTPQEPA